MCTAIAFKGDDLLYGFNFDVDPAVWPFTVRKNKNLFAVGIAAGKTTYLVHGINRCGSFGNVPYMNGDAVPVPHRGLRARIDLMSDRYVRGRYSLADVEDILRTKTLYGIPAAPMHSLIGNGDGQMLIVEPGLGYRRVDENYAVLTNFPVLTALPDYSNPFYGKDRYDKAVSVLSSARPDFSAEDALQLLYDVRQEGQWATRVTFVWSRNRNAVYYYLNGNIGQAECHMLG